MILPWAPNTVGWHCNSQQQSQKSVTSHPSLTPNMSNNKMGPGIARRITNRCLMWSLRVDISQKDEPYAGLYFVSKDHVQKCIQVCEPQQLKNMIDIPPQQHHSGVVMDFIQVSNPHPCWEQYPPPHPAPPGLLWFNVFQSAAERVSQPIFNQGTWAQDSLIESVQESTLNPCSSEGRVNWEWTHWKKAAEKWQN